MASIPFTLAALATSAVPGLAVFGVREHDEDPSYAEAIVVSEDAELLVRVPRTQAAEVQQSATVLGLAALTPGPRGRLPFTVPETLGMTRAGDTRAVVTTLVPGGRFVVEDLTTDALLLQPLAETIAAIHELPLSVAQNGGLPVLTTQDLRLVATRIIDRAEATRLLPETVLQRWQRAVESAELWDFAPTTVHGSLDAGQFRVSDDRVTGVLGWSELAVGDPASDLAWLLEPGNEVFDSVLARYSGQRNVGSVSHLRTRAALYHELEVAKWLLHGVEAHDQTVVDDAVAMLDRMVGVGGVLSLAFASVHDRAPMSEREVEDLLLDTPEVLSHLSDTAAVEALDEDRMFANETDFIDPLTADDTDAIGDGAAAAAASGSAAAGLGHADREPEDEPFAALSADTGVVPDFDFSAETLLPSRSGAATEPSEPPAPTTSAAALSEDDQLTEPYDPDDLPSPRGR